MTLFRPCIDLHEGRVKQLVGGTLTDAGARENFVSSRSAAEYAELYRRDGLRGGHVIQLGPGNESAAEEALRAAPGTLQIGGGIRPENARRWLDRGATHVIVTSYLFENGLFSEARLAALAEVVTKEELVIDLSCRKTSAGYHVATDRWQTITPTLVSEALLEKLAPVCAELLIHAADVEGLCRGIDEELVSFLGQASPLPCTYAGGAMALADLELVERLSQGRVDLTIGSALDLFGGTGVRYADCVAWNRAHGA